MIHSSDKFENENEKRGRKPFAVNVKAALGMNSYVQSFHLYAFIC